MYMQQLFAIISLVILSIGLLWSGKAHRRKQIQKPSPEKNLAQCKKCTIINHDGRGGNGTEKSKEISKEEAKPKAEDKIDETKLMKEFEKSIAELVGLKELKMQLENWAKGMLLDKKRKAMNIPIRKRIIPHMVFMGNPGTGKTMVANLIGKILHRMGLLKTKKVTVVQRTDLVGQHIGRTGPKTRKKLKEARGGLLFVDEAYKLIIPTSSNDFGIQALEEIMSFMDTGEVIVVFAGYPEAMKNIIDSNEGFRRRVTKFFYFDDFTPLELTEMLHLKVTKAGSDNLIKGYKLDPSCTTENISELISRGTTKEFRSKRNGGLVDSLLQNARENLDARLDLQCDDVDSIVTITMEDLDNGLKRLCREGEYQISESSYCNLYI